MYNTEDARLYMDIANRLSLKSSDRKTKVGAVIFDSDKKIIVGEGWNRFPDGCTDKDKFSWDSRKNTKNNKHMYVVHAEANAIVRKDFKNLNGCIIYVTHLPCTDCARLIVEAGINTVIYGKIWKEEEKKKTLDIFNECEVECLQFSEQTNE